MRHCAGCFYSETTEGWLGSQAPVFCGAVLAGEDIYGFLTTWGMWGRAGQKSWERRMHLERFWRNMPFPVLFLPEIKDGMLRAEGLQIFRDLRAYVDI